MIGDVIVQCASNTAYRQSTYIKDRKVDYSQTNYKLRMHIDRINEK